MDARARHEIDAAVERMLARLGAAIESDARRYVPVDTGELRASINAEASAGGAIRVVATAGHAAYQELGTRHQPAQPFLRPALYQRRDLGGV